MTEAASALGRDVSTVNRVAARHGITFARGRTGRAPEYESIQIGVNRYASVKAAAASEQVDESWIYECLRNGTPEKIGSRRNHLQGAK